jgi:SSS family solute:Na+ symporter
VVSLVTKPKPESELVGLVHSLTPKPPQHHLAWWQKPETLGAAVIIGAIALNLFFA